MSRFGAIAVHRAFGVGLAVLFVIILISASAQADTLTMEANTDRMGADYRRIDGCSSVEACHSACLVEKECDAYTYVKSAHHCWLKRGVPGPTPNNDTISGVKKRAIGDGICATVSAVTCEPNTDRMGADYQRIHNAPSVQFCQNQCAADPKCAAFTYVRSAYLCWLKNGVPNVTHNSDTVSGVKLSKPVPVAPQGHGNWQSVVTGDCPGRDIASTKGPNPDPARCTDAVRGQTAVCWEHGCTYKNIPTGSCTGGMNPGRMYTCNPADRNTPDDKQSEYSGVLAGTGGDGQIYRAGWTQFATIRPLQYYAHEYKEFVHFSLDNVPYPNREWGVDKLSWSISSARSGALSGIGGDGRIYSAEWTGNKTLRPLQYYRLGSKIFLHFSLDGKPWPNSEWGVEQSSW